MDSAPNELKAPPLRDFVERRGLANDLSAGGTTPRRSAGSQNRAPSTFQPARRARPLADPRRHFWLLATAGCCWLQLCPVQAQSADDWELTRPAPLKSKRSAAPLEPQTALRRVLSAAFDLAAIERVIALFRSRDGDLSGLSDALEQANAPSPAPAMVLRARVEQERGDADAARAWLERADALAPNAAVLRAHAMFEHALGRLDEERSLLEAALRLAKDTATREQLETELASRCLELGDVAAARAHFATRAQRNPGSVAHALAFARALAMHGQADQASAAYADALASLQSDPRVVPGLLLEWARVQLSAAQPEPALANLRRAQRMAAGASGLQAEIAWQRFGAQQRLGTLADYARELEARREHSEPNDDLLARCYEELAQPAAAIAVLRRVLARRPNDVDVAQRLLALLWREGRVEDVVAEYQRLLQRPEQAVRYVRELCQLLQQIGQPERALTTLARLSRQHPRDVVVHEAIAELYTSLGEATRAQAELELLAKIDPAPERFVQLGEAELAAGRKALAGTHFRRAVQGVDRGVAASRLGEIYLDHDFLNEALAEYDRALTLQPKAAALARGRAEVLMRLFRFKDAGEQWARLLTLSAADRELQREARKQLVGVWDELARLEANGAELADRCGYSLVSGFSSREPSAACDHGALLTLAEAYERMARRARVRVQSQRYLSAAEDVLARAVALAPAEVDGWLALERLRTKRGNLDGARVALEQLTQIDPTHRREHLARMIGHALARYRDVDAARYAQRAVDAAPDDPSAHEQLGDLYRAQNDVPRALASYERALSLDPGRLNLTLRVAQLELAIGREETAEPRLHSVVRGALDDELVLRAARSLLQLAQSQARLLALEHELIPLALAVPARPVYRRALLELYAVLVPRLAAVAHSQEQDAVAARAQLQAIGRRSAKPLIDALVDPDPTQVRAALMLLREVGSAELAGPLLSVGESGAELQARREALYLSVVLSERVRASQVGSGVAHGGGASASAALVPRWTALLNGREGRLQEVAIWALAREASASAGRAVHATVSSPVALLRGHALLGIAQRDEPDAPRVLQRAVAHDPSPWVRAAAVIGLGVAGDVTALPLLAATTKETQQPKLADGAVLALGLLGDERAQASLTRALFSADEQVRRDAALALSALSVAEQDRAEPPILPPSATSGPAPAGASTALPPTAASDRAPAGASPAPPSATSGRAPAGASVAPPSATSGRAPAGAWVARPPPAARRRAQPGASVALPPTAASEPERAGAPTAMLPMAAHEAARAAVAPRDSGWPDAAAGVPERTPRGRVRPAFDVPLMPDHPLGIDELLAAARASLQQSAQCAGRERDAAATLEYAAALEASTRDALRGDISSKLAALSFLASPCAQLSSGTSDARTPFEARGSAACRLAAPLAAAQSCASREGADSSTPFDSPPLAAAESCASGEGADSSTPFDSPPLAAAESCASREAADAMTSIAAGESLSLAPRPALPLDALVSCDRRASLADASHASTKATPDLRIAVWPELQQLRADANPLLRAKLVAALVTLRAAAADALLLELAEDAAPAVRGAALHALADRPLHEQPGWASRLGKLARFDRAFWLRQRAVLVLRKLPSQLATQTLTQIATREPYALVRESAVQSLAGRDANRVKSTLLAALRDPETRVVKAAARALQACGRACTASQAAPMN